MNRNLLLAGAMALALAPLSACTTTGAYTGDTYYGPAGSGIQCRIAGEKGKDGTVLPGGAYAGGNCRPKAEWAR